MSLRALQSYLPRYDWLAVLAFSAAEMPQIEYQNIYYKALAIYNQMKDLQRSLTNDLDVVYAGILAMAPASKRMLWMN